MAGFGPASLPHLALVLDSVAPGGSAKAPAPLPSLGLVMYDAGIFCSVAKTLGSVTSSSGGTVSVSGTLAKTLANVSISSVGTTFADYGSVGAAAPLPHLSTLFESIAGIVGQTSKTLEALTSVSEGDVPGNEIWPYEYEDKPPRAPLYWPHARNVDWFQTDTVLRDNTGGRVGVVGQTLANLTLSSSLSIRSNATLAKTLDNVTFSSQGTVSVSGQTAKTLGALTVSGSAFVVGEFVGTLSKTLDALTVSSSTLGSISASTNATLGSLTSSSSASVAVDAVLSRTLQGINANIDGSVLSGYVAVVNNFLEPLGCRADGNNGTTARRHAGGVRKRGKDTDSRRRFFVVIDDEEFTVESEEEAIALVAAAKEMAETVAKAQASAAVEKRVTEKAVDTSPVDLEVPKIMSDDPAIERELKDAVTAIFERAERDAEIELHLQKQRLLDEEDDVVLLLIS